MSKTQHFWHCCLKNDWNDQLTSSWSTYRCSSAWKRSKHDYMRREPESNLLFRSSVCSHTRNLTLVSNCSDTHTRKPKQLQICWRLVGIKTGKRSGSEIHRANSSQHTFFALHMFRTWLLDSSAHQSTRCYATFSLHYIRCTCRLWSMLYGGRTVLGCSYHGCEQAMHSHIMMVLCCSYHKGNSCVKNVEHCGRTEVIFRRLSRSSYTWNLIVTSSAVPMVILEQSDVNCTVKSAYI